MVTHRRVKLTERDDKSRRRTEHVNVRTLTFETIVPRLEESTSIQENIVMFSEERGIDERTIQKEK